MPVLPGESRMANPEPTASEVFWFKIFRTCVGSTVLGLTGLFIIATLAPLFMETAFNAPPSPPAKPWVLWTGHDAQASREILLISSCQALLMGGCYLVYRWRGGSQHLYAEARQAEHLRVARPQKAERVKGRASKSKTKTEPRKDVVEAGQGGVASADLDGPLEAAADTAIPK